MADRDGKACQRGVRIYDRPLVIETLRQMGTARGWFNQVRLGPKTIHIGEE